MNFFTADSHFNHGNIIAYCKRPWLKDGDYNYETNQWSSLKIKEERTIENDEIIIQNWNSVVKPNDNIYHLGDFAFTNSTKQTEEYIKRLNGKIYLILGNHDKNPVRKAKGFQWISEPYQGKMVKINNKHIFLNHYACRTWSRSHFGVLHLYGHSHGTLSSYHSSLDVGVDCWNYTPVSFDQIIETDPCSSGDKRTEAIITKRRNPWRGCGHNPYEDIAKALNKTEETFPSVSNAERNEGLK